MNARRSFRKAAAALSAFVLAACMGGTGTDTENGIQPVLVMVRVVADGDVPVASVRIDVNHVYSRADSATESPVVEEDTAALTTDELGFASFRLVMEGEYVAQGSVKDSILFLDTLRARSARDSIVSGSFGGILFHVEEPLRAAGRLRLLSGYRPDSGRIVLRGTKLLWKLGEDGAYDLGWLPPAAEKMTLRVVYWASPTDSSAAPACVRPGNTGRNPATLRIADGEIVVNDLLDGPGCPSAAP